MKKNRSLPNREAECSQLSRVNAWGFKVPEEKVLPLLSANGSSYQSSTFAHKKILWDVKAWDGTQGSFGYRLRRGLQTMTLFSTKIVFRYPV